MPIIRFFGPDESGKTSLARRTALTFAARVREKAKAKIYVTADIGELHRRSYENTEFLTRQLKLYGALAKALNAYTLNTMHKSVENSLQEIKPLIDLQNLSPIARKDHSSNMSGWL